MRHGRIHFCSLLAAAAVLAAAARSAHAADLDNPVTKGNVTIALPKGWPSAAGTGRSVLSALAPAPDKDGTGQFQASLTITQDPGTKIDAAAQQKTIAGQVTVYKVVENPSPTAAGGVQGVLFGGTFKRGTADLRSRQYMFLVNNQIYTVTFTCLSSQWAKYEPAVAASVVTMTMKK